nr:hypothetical protein [Oscillatoria sp. FACHB-1406]
MVELVAKNLENLIDNPYPQNSRHEPLPGKLKLSEEWTFHKLDLKISKGASGQVRLMYLVNTTTKMIKLVWIYSHEQFSKRPPDRELKGLIQDIIN